MDLSLVKRPSAFVPVVMSLIALAMVLGYVALYGAQPHGVQHNHDERAPARIFQLLLMLQAPIILFFAMRWLPRQPRETLIVLALQIGAACAAVATIVFFERMFGAG